MFKIILNNKIKHSLPYICVLNAILARHTQTKLDFVKTNQYGFIFTEKYVFEFKHQGKAKMEKLFLPKSLFLCITFTFGWEKNIGRKY